MAAVPGLDAVDGGGADAGVGGGLGVGSLWLTGVCGWEQLWRGLVMLAGVALGFCVGKALGGRMSPGAMRYAMLTLAGSAGLLLLVRSL